MSLKKKKSSLTRSALRFALVLPGLALWYALPAAAEPVTVYKGGIKVTENRGYIRIKGNPNAGGRILKPSVSGYDDVSGLLGAPGKVWKVKPKKVNQNQFCSHQRDKICVVSGSLIIHVGRRKR